MRAYLACSIPFASLFAAPAHADFVLTETQFQVLTVAAAQGATGNVYDQDSEESTLLNTLYDETVSSDVGASGSSGGSSEAGATSRVYFDAFGSPGLISAFGQTSGGALQHADVYVDPGPPPQTLYYALSAAAFAQSTLSFYFTLTTPFMYNLTASVSGNQVPSFGFPVTSVHFGGGPAALLFELSTIGTEGTSGVLEPGSYWFTGNTSTQAGTPCCVADSTANFFHRWSVDLQLTPVPLPAAAWLLASGLAMFGTLVQRRRG